MDVETVIGNIIHHALRSQHIQRLDHGGAADAELLGQHVLVDLDIAVLLVFQHIVADILIGLLDQNIFCH